MFSLVCFGGIGVGQCFDDDDDHLEIYLANKVPVCSVFGQVIDVVGVKYKKIPYFANFLDISYQW